MIVDSHCHLDLITAKGVLIEDILEHASQNKVGILQTICTKVSQFESSILPFADKYDHIYASIGIHPLSVDSEPAIEKADLTKWFDHNKVIGIGETGLDYYRDGYPDKTKQIDRLLLHIEASKEVDAPIIIHNRASDEDMIDILKSEYTNYSNARGLIHCFSSSKKLAEVALELGFYISMSGILTFNSAKDLQDMVSSGLIPLDRLLVETDAPYLSPAPHRNEQTNLPGYTFYVVKKLAELLGVDFDEIENRTTSNFYRLFSRVPAQNLV